MKIDVVNSSKNALPAYETKGAAGMDVRADFSKVSPTNPIKVFGDGEIYFKSEAYSKTMLRLEPGSRALIPTGLKIEVPEGYFMAIHPRSGLSLKKGLTCCNAVGVCDSDYRGDVGIIIVNLGQETAWIEDGERIAQLILMPYSQFEWNQVESLDKTERGEGGFGSTGSK